MQRLAMLILAMTGIFAVSPASSAASAKFTTMKTWAAGTSTNMRGKQIEVGDELAAADRTWCRELLQLANKSQFARKRVDPERKLYLPSAFRLSRWTTIVKPAVVPASDAARSQSPYTLLPVQYQEIDDCGKPTRKGMFNIICRFEEITANLRPRGSVKLARMTLIFVNNAEKLNSITRYYVMDDQNRISMNLDILPNDRQSATFTFDGQDLIATWSKEFFDFSSGYAGRRFRSPKVTLNISSLETMEGYGIVATRRCVLALTPAPRS